MSRSTPIIPPGSPLHRREPVPSSKLIVSVSAIVLVHAAVLTGLLIQGCQRQDSATSPPQGTTEDALSSTTPSTSFQANPFPADPEPVFAAPPPRTEPPGLGVRPEAPTLPGTPQGTTVNADPIVRDIPQPVRQLPKAPPSFTGGAPSEMIRYEVKAGDNLTKLARTHNTTIQAIRAANNLKTDRILIGQKLKIPAGQGGRESAAPVDRAVEANPFNSGPR